MARWSTRTVRLFILSTVWPDPAGVLGWIGKLSAYKSGQKGVTSLSSHCWSLQSCCGPVAGSQAHVFAVLAVQPATSPTRSPHGRGSGNTHTQVQGCETSLCGLACWRGGRTILHGIPGTFTGFHWEQKSPEPGPGCQAGTFRRPAVPLWLPLTWLKVPYLQANPHPSLLGCSKTSVKSGAWVLDYFSLILLE